nr:N-acetyltransferase family protein [Candidatus Freyarchaeota archaeon]
MLIAFRLASNVWCVSETAGRLDMLKIRDAKINDLTAITEIYNDAIIHTVATFDTQPRTVEEQKIWFSNHNSKFPLIVAEDNDLITGWASLSMWSDRCAYSDTAEISLYVKEGYRGKGTGKKLTEAILSKGENAGIHTIIARIEETNKASIHLFETLGFSHIGTMREVGRKFGKLLDVHLMQKIFNSPGNVA